MKLLAHFSTTRIAVMRKTLAVKIGVYETILSQEIYSELQEVFGMADRLASVFLLCFSFPLGPKSPKFLGAPILRLIQEILVLQH